MTATTTRPAGPSALRVPQKQPRDFSLASVTGKGSQLPGRYVLHAVEGAGKTTFGTNWPKPIFVQTKGETGLETLIDAKRVKEVPHFPATETWEELQGCIATLTASEHDYGTLVIDTINGAERLCHEYVCLRDYGGQFTKAGFLSYMQGYDASLADWRGFLSSLDELRATRKMRILCLCHTKIAPFRNPEGSDYDRYTPAVHPKTWELTSRWADAVLFLNFETVVVEEGGRKKARGGQRRVMYTERHAAYDAKNRLGLAEEIDLGNSPADAWTNFQAALVAGRNGE